MIIGVDAGCLGIKDIHQQTGVWRFAVEILSSLTHQDKENNYFLYSFEKIPAGILGKFSNNVKNIVLKPQKFWLSGRLSAEFLRKKQDLFLGLSQALPFYHPFPSIIFVHDLAFEKFPQAYGNNYKRLSRQTKFAVKHCDKIVAVSKATKGDLVKLYGIAENKIEVIYHGVSKNFQPVEQIKSKKPYILFVGTLKPLKNIGRMMAAFRIFNRKMKNNYQLVLAGANELKIKSDKEIHVLGFVDDRDLPSLYLGAEIFLSPSLAEGFGLPIAEAMSAGLPVVTSDIPTIKEIAGDSVLYADPYDIEDISRKLYQIAVDKKLSCKIGEAGKNRAKSFSWDKSADKLLKIINQYA
ncbi:glycosyltransferase family 4 protein [Candidatus Microgenomates bacterium]|nr:glycosyltransferase family 4 protein [Candidatus Microgenomates bacterium]